MLKPWLHVYSNKDVERKVLLQTQAIILKGMFNDLLSYMNFIIVGFAPIL